MNYLLELKTNHVHPLWAVFLQWNKCNTVSWGIPATDGSWNKSHQLGSLGASTLHCADCVHTVISLLHCEYDMLLMAACQVFTWFIRHHSRQGISHQHYSDKSLCHHRKLTPTEGVKISMKMFLFSTLSLVWWSTAGDLSCLGGRISSHLPKSFLV